MADQDVYAASLEEYNQEHKTSILNFKPLQKETLNNVLQGDTISVLPTGYGKSLIYEILPKIHNKFCDKTAFIIIIVPLNVILDQQLRKFGNKAISLSACLKTLHSSSPEGTKLLNGHYIYLFAHPESIIDQKTVNEIFLHKHFQEDVKTYIVIDEAHCILDWGDSFRPAFQRLHRLRAVLPHATILAMTATLSLKGQNDIAKLLALKNHKVVSTYPARDNISIIVIKRPSGTSAEEESAKASVEYCIEPLILELIDKGQNFPLTIVYFSGSQNWVGVSYELSKNILGPKFYVDSYNEDSARVVMYHASLEKESDQLRQTILKNLSMDPSDSPLKLVFSTVALGMGADLRHVRRVIQIGPPKTMEAYVQQIGRAGRTGEQASSILYYNNSDVGRPAVVQEMKDLCKSNTVCRRKMVNSSFGFSDFPAVPAEVCCDICHPELKSPYIYESSRNLKDAVRNTILSYMAEDDSGYVKGILSTSTIEQIVCQPHRFAKEDTLKSAFNLDDSVVKALSTIITSILQLHNK